MILCGNEDGIFDLDPTAELNLMAEANQLPASILGFMIFGAGEEKYHDVAAELALFA